ncbi:hypothetical protein DUI87_20605 [Hirundo rustica rustica]|uniref:ribonuclease H n=1 Tax=Hirundo rustica rustica TaxID=333673 RepID=A0A3M0JQV5_HIRRU|nr:hypothetical protein DUI87_20605 [Hirundo rustica rustica]
MTKMTIFLPGKEVSENFEDAQQALIPVQRVKEKEKEKETEKEKEKETEKETKPEEVKPPKQPEFSPTDWTDIKKFALKGDTLSMDPKGIAMPVTYDAHDANPKWERLDREVVRDLMKAVRDNGLGSPYFKQLLKGTFNIYDLTPFDLRSLATMILSDSQFILWEAQWRKILNDYRIKYQGGANAGFTVAQLAGDPPLDSAARQDSFLPRDVLTDIKDAARKAMVQIPPAGVTESLFTDVKQGPSEPFASFIDRLTQAVDRQVIDEGVKSHMIRCLAFANANPECKRVISAMPGQPTMAEILEACSKVGTPQHVATILGDQCGKSCQRSICKFSTKTVLQVWQTRTFQEGLPTNYKQCRLIRSLFGMREKEASSCEKQCKWRNSVGKLQKERGSSTRDDTSDGDDSRASSARGTIIGEQHSDALSRTICRIPSDPELLPPGAQCDLATSKVICFLDDKYAVIPTGVTGSSWKRQDFLIIEPTPPIIRHFFKQHENKTEGKSFGFGQKPETGQIEGPFKLITWGKGYACVSTAVGPKWLAARHVKPYRVQTQAETDPKTGGREVGTQTDEWEWKAPYGAPRDRLHKPLKEKVGQANWLTSKLFNWPWTLLKERSSTKLAKALPLHCLDAPPCQVTVRLKDHGRFWGEVKAKVEGLSDGADAGHAVSGVQPVPSRVPASDSVGPTGQDMAGAAASSEGLQAFPVLQGATHNTYQPLAWQALAELRDAVRKYGLGSAKVVQVLCYFNASLLTPFDIWSLARALFPLVEYDFFEHKWTQLAVRAVERNRTLGQGDPRRMVNTDMLMRTGNYTRADRQAGFEPLVQEQCQQTGMAALVQTIQLATPQQPFATIIQGIDEPFLCFAGRLTAAVEKESSVSRTEDRLQGDGGFGSTGPPQVRWTAVLTKDHPETLCAMSVAGATLSEFHLRGLLDTRADEQLDQGHLEPSTSPWNTPVFCIKKKSGKWRLLQDLRKINAVMEGMGTLQAGMPLPTMLPADWPVLIVDLKDCFFTIPLHPDDRPKFAFTVPTINNAKPAQRYPWRVLPQGMRNSQCYANGDTDLKSPLELTPEARKMLEEVQQAVSACQVYRIEPSIDVTVFITTPDLHPTGEKAHDVIAHWRQAFAVLGIPSAVKTDNGLAYASQQALDSAQQPRVKVQVRNLVTKQ